MKRLFIFAVCIVSALVSFAQYSLVLKGTSFNVATDDETMTATILDRTYKIDDRPYAYGTKSRKIKDFIYEQERTLEVPSTFTHNGKTYAITTIGRAAFAGYKNIDYIKLPTSVTAIGDYAFYNSSALMIDIPKTVTAIGVRAFGKCSRLQQLRLPESARERGKTLFAESKHCQTNYYTPDTAPIDTDNIKPKPYPQPVLATTSDVDTDLPVAKKTNDNTFAIIIANENYKQEPHVICAMHDGEVFRDYCQTVLGLPSENINFVTDATKNEMMAAMDWVKSVTNVYKEDARVILYYTGHGIPDDDSRSSYLLPVDAVGNNPKMAYSLRDLYASLGQLEARDVTVFIDACFSGSDRGEGTVGGHSRGVMIKAKPEDAYGNMVVFAAAQGSETAWPYKDKAHGLFTYFLLKKLKETRGEVSYGELADYVQKQVARRSIVVNKKSQTPAITASSSMERKWQKLTFFK